MLEETGLQVTDVRFLTAINNVMMEGGKHYVTIFVGCRLVDEDAEPVVCFICSFPLGYLVVVEERLVLTVWSVGDGT